MEWSVQERDGRAILFAARPDDGQGLYKVWLRGRTGRCLLGTMSPGDGRLVLRRVLPVADLANRGCWPAEGMEAQLSFPFSAPAPVPSGWRELRGLSFPDPVVDAAVRRAAGGLYRPEGSEGFLLAYPYRPACPFPLVPLFCLARLGRLAGGDFLLFSFDREGNPVLAHNSSPYGDTSPKP